MESISLEDSKEIERLEVTLENPVPDAEAVKKADFVFVRHGFSEYNCAAKIFEIETGKHQKAEESKAHRQGYDFIDCHLHKYGVLQARMNQKLVNNIDFQVVLVSPLRRAMETSYYIFENHPNRQNIKFVVMPIVRECIDTSNDLPTGTLTTLKDEFTDKNGVSYDFSMFSEYEKPELWYIETLADKDLKDYLLDKIKKREDGTYNDIEVMMEEFDKNFPEKTEQWKYIYQRTLNAKQALKKYLKENPLAEGKKIGVVTHSAFLEAFTSTGIENDELVGGSWFQNCEVRPIEF